MTTADLHTGRLDTRPTTSLGVTAAVVAAALTAFGAHTWTEVLVCVALIAATTALVFGVVVPRALRGERLGTTALALAVPAALLLLPAFWAGVPFVLAVGAMVVGHAGRSAASGAGRSVAGLAVGALVALGYLATYASEIVGGTGGFEYL